MRPLGRLPDRLDAEIIATLWATSGPMLNVRLRCRQPATDAGIAPCGRDDGWSGDAQLELIQPLTGYSIYDEHLERRGEGLHHIKLYHADCAKAVREYAARGYPVLQCGKIDDDEHYYLDTEKDFGYIVELGNAGRIRPAERRYPQP